MIKKIRIKRKNDKKMIKKNKNKKKNEINEMNKDYSSLIISRISSR